MNEFLSKDTIKILKKYKDIEPFEHVNGVDICSIDQSDLSFMLGYISASLRIEEKLKKQIERHENILKEIVELTKYEGNQWYENAKKALES